MDPFPDTDQTLKGKILECIENYSRYGIFRQPGGKRRFAFIHGDWSLDNSGGKWLCGVNNELTILIECGCYADFTFPCLNVSQPAMVNRLYYALDDIEKPKSYNHGIPVQEGRPAPHNSLMLVQGIIGLRHEARKLLKVAIEHSDLDTNDPPTPDRVDFWVKNALYIVGRPEWRFIKLHTHGATEGRWDVNFGSTAEIAFEYMERVYNDGQNYILHYVTAREMYNIIKAAEAGLKGNPDEYRNFDVLPYPYIF